MRKVAHLIVGAVIIGVATYFINKIIGPWARAWSAPTPTEPYPMPLAFAYILALALLSAEVVGAGLVAYGLFHFCSWVGELAVLGAEEVIDVGKKRLEEKKARAVVAALQDGQISVASDTHGQVSVVQRVVQR